MSEALKNKIRSLFFRCYYFGGYGPRPFDMPNPGLYLRDVGDFIADETSPFYWNNQLLIFDPDPRKQLNWTLAKYVFLQGDFVNYRKNFIFVLKFGFLSFALVKFTVYALLLIIKNVKKVR